MPHTLDLMHPIIDSAETLNGAWADKRPSQVVLKAEKLQRGIEFIGVVTRSHGMGLGDASCWWGSKDMAGKVWYSVSNGRYLSGPTLFSEDGPTWTQGEEVMSPAERKLRNTAHSDIWGTFCHPKLSNAASAPVAMFLRLDFTAPGGRMCVLPVKGNATDGQPIA
jgi:hypothetical protein